MRKLYSRASGGFAAILALAAAIAGKDRVAAYNQVLQTLLDRQSLFARNKQGLNVVLLRGEDATPPVDELADAIRMASLHTAVPLLVCLCPGSLRLDEDLEGALAGIPSVHFFPAARLMELYPVTCLHDEVAGRLGHMPYAVEAYAAIGTAIARMFHACRRPPYKVIAVDGDNTLWRGVCGEGGVRIDPASRALQSFLKARREAGMLLCLCSKNAGEDVEAVFNAHPGMPLQRSDFAAWRVNWLPKSANLRSLATELSLALDAFLFLDDSPMETAEVRAHCPEVLALLLPPDPASVPGFLQHVWAFDQPFVTAEDRNRTAVYRANENRRKDGAASLSYADFIAGLKMEIEIREPRGAEEIARAAQLTQRTNQFNLTTQRLTEAGIRQAIAGSLRILTAFVRDRYGDYGQAGLLLYQIEDDALRVENLILSCRVLGKGVEHAIVARCGQTAQEQLRDIVEIPFIPTAKNTPAHDFLNGFALPYRNGCPSGFRYRVPAAVAAGLRFKAPLDTPPASAAARTFEAPRTAVDFAWIATHHRDAASILRAVDEAREISAGSGSAKPARDSVETLLIQIWERILRVRPIGVDDNFFELGGDSLRAVRVLSALHEAGHRELPLSSVAAAPTIARFAELLRPNGRALPCACLTPLKSSGGRPPFYCVHGVGGSVLELMDLASHSHPDQPFYGIQASGLSGGPPGQRDTVEEMARRYLQEVRAFQPSGPYYLGGSSFGGLVAYEMARQLDALDQNVGLLALFDTSVPGCSAERQSRLAALRYAARLHGGNVFAARGRQRLAYLLSKTGRLLRPAPLPEHIRQVREAGQWAAARYAPESYAGTVTLFRAIRQPSWVRCGPALGWDRLALGGVHIHETPGCHADLVRNPRARVLARQLEEALSQPCVA